MNSFAGIGASHPTLVNRDDCKLWMWRNWSLILTACFALIWIFHRAIVQSITLDEANTFLRWVAPDSPAHWEPHSNNHVLNSTLMRLCIWLLGLSQMAVRAPALRSEEHTSELQSQSNLVCRLLLEKKKKQTNTLQYAKDKNIEQHH